MKTENSTRKDAGFTLVEMLVVVSIVAVLMAAVAINLLPKRDEAMVQRAKADLRTIESALELYRLDNFNYPTESEGLEALTTPTTSNGVTREPYLKREPIDPWGQPYVYVFPGENGAYDLLSYGADSQPGGEELNADIGHWMP